MKQQIRQPVFDNIPDGLKELSQWVVWKAKRKENGKIDKPPFNAKSGKAASHSNSKTWTTFKQAVNCYENSNSTYAGIGFVFAETDPFCGIDLDNCRDPETGQLLTWAEDILKELNSYSEISPSNTGVKVFVKSNLSEGGRKQGNIEVYNKQRFFTVTGGWLGDYSGDIESRQEQVTELYNSLRPKVEKTPQKKGAAPSFKDKEIIRKAIEGKNGEKFLHLLNGEWFEEAYPSQSEADQALCNHLAFYCGNNCEQINRIFKTSGLMRDKWDKQHYGDGRTYGQATIEKAISSVKETYSGGKGKQYQDNKRQVPMSIILVEIAKGFDFFHTNDDEVYAQYRTNDHRELWNIRNKKFKNHISNIAYDAEGRMPSDNAIKDALNVIEGIARFDRNIKIEVHTRIARVKDTIYIDLVNDQWEIIEINKDGWKVVKSSPMYFERTKGMLPLPHPVPGGKITDLKELLNLPNDNDATWILIVSWVLQAMNDIGSYPIFIVNGEQGSAKSTLSKLVRSIVDPNQADLRSLPRNEHDIVIAARNGWVLGFDNLSGMQNWLSDALCRISTGAGFATRKLYSDNEEEIFYSRKPIILNGINSLVRRNDLADRAILISLPPIEGEGNIKESVLQKHFSGNLPSILGGFYSAVSEGLKNKDLTFGNLPRMADFANWIQQAEPALPWAKGRFIQAYQENRASIIEESINQDLVGSAIKNWVESWALQVEWEGSASDLLDIFQQDMSENTIRSKGWPQDASSLSRRINSQAKFLRQCGIEVEKLARNSKGQPLKIKKLTVF